jgi:hypothetical protein
MQIGDVILVFISMDVSLYTSCLLAWVLLFFQFDLIHQFTKLDLGFTLGSNSDSLPKGFCDYVNGPCSSDSAVLLNDETYTKMTEKNIGKDQVRLLVLLLTYNEKRVWKWPYTAPNCGGFLHDNDIFLLWKKRHRSLLVPAVLRPHRRCSRGKRELFFPPATVYCSWHVCRVCIVWHYQVLPSVLFLTCVGTYIGSTLPCSSPFPFLGLILDGMAG